MLHDVHEGPKRRPMIPGSSQRRECATIPSQARSGLTTNSGTMPYPRCSLTFTGHTQPSRGARSTVLFLLLATCIASRPGKSASRRHPIPKASLLRHKSQVTRQAHHHLQGLGFEIDLGKGHRIYIYVLVYIARDIMCFVRLKTVGW